MGKKEQPVVKYPAVIDDSAPQRMQCSNFPTAFEIPRCARIPRHPPALVGIDLQRHGGANGLRTVVANPLPLHRPCRQPRHEIALHHRGEEKDRNA